MVQLNKINVTDFFLRLTGITAEDFSQHAIIDNSVSYIENRLAVDTLTESQQERCEYAAAVHAVYDYILTRNLTEKITVSQSGKVINQNYRDYSITAAYELKKSVFDSIKSLVGDDGFTFFTTEGK